MQKVLAPGRPQTWEKNIFRQSPILYLKYIVCQKKMEVIKQFNTCLYKCVCMLSKYLLSTILTDQERKKKPVKSLQRFNFLKPIILDGFLKNQVFYRKAQISCHLSVMSSTQCCFWCLRLELERSYTNKRKTRKEELGKQSHEKNPCHKTTSICGQNIWPQPRNCLYD